LPPCQSVTADTVSLDPSILIEDGRGYINICPGDTFSVEGAGIYAQNNTNYTQDDATSIFTWTFGNEDTVIGQNISYVYPDSGIYSLGLIVEDVQGCRSINQFDIRIRRSVNPDLHIDPASAQLCLGESLSLTGLIENTAIDSIYFGDTLRTDGTAEITDSIFIPDDSNNNTWDGISTPVIYPLTISGYQPGATLTDINDLLEVCLSIEHSYAGDLDL
ncbi:MAG: PKD domain-containing protein, partial [Chitinophagales bacterium]